MKVLMTSLVVILAGLGSEACACSCSKPMRIELALREARLIVIAEAVSVEQHPRYGNANPTAVTEDAQFKVIETLKGARRPGDVLHIRSELGPGACGVSARNSPVWLETMVKGKPVGRPLSGRWLIYVMADASRGPTAIELSLCGRSSPLEVNGAKEARRLHSLIARQRAPDLPH
jgi:hypothetical protein